MSTSPSASAFRDAVDAAMCGRFAPVQELLRAALPAAERFALETHLHMAGLGDAPRDPPPRSASANDTAESAGLFIAERIALVRGDAPALRDLAARRSPIDAEGQAQAAAAESWLAYLAEPTQLKDAATKLHGLVQGRPWPALRIEAKALEALAACEDGDLSAAVGAARMASRMASAEALPQWEYLAHTVLARVRRRAGAPHLAIRILRSLRSIASPIWHAWLSCEAVLSGAAIDDTMEASSRYAHSAERLEAWLRGDDAGRIEAPAVVAMEAEYLRAMVDVGAAVHPKVSPWINGATHEVPLGLHGVSSSPQSAARLAFVAAVPGAARRILSVKGEPRGALGVRLCDGPRPQERTATGLSLLLLQSEAMPLEEFFRVLYGFEYEVLSHKGIVDTLIHRMRDALGDAGTIDRQGLSISIEVHAPLHVPDPRCAAPLEDRVLAFLAEAGGHSAKEASKGLAIPLRTVQQALKRLTEDGACVVRKEGRGVRYAVEDTTFTEPTVAG